MSSLPKIAPNFTVNSDADELPKIQQGAPPRTKLEKVNSTVAEISLAELTPTSGGKDPTSASSGKHVFVADSRNYLPAVSQNNGQKSARKKSALHLPAGMAPGVVAGQMPSIPITSGATDSTGLYRNLRHSGAVTKASARTLHQSQTAPKLLTVQKEEVGARRSTTPLSDFLGRQPSSILDNRAGAQSEPPPSANAGQDDALSHRGGPPRRRRFQNNGLTLPAINTFGAKPFLPSLDSGETHINPPLPATLSSVARRKKDVSLNLAALPGSPPVSRGSQQQPPTTSGTHRSSISSNENATERTERTARASHRSTGRSSYYDVAGSTMVTSRASARNRSPSSIVHEERMAVNYQRRQLIAEAEQLEKERAFEEMEQYREYRRNEAIEGPKREELLQRQCRWLGLIMSILPLIRWTTNARHVSAFVVLKHVFAPILRRRMRLRLRQNDVKARSEEARKKMTRLTWETLAAHKFFQMLPRSCLGRLCEHMEPIAFLPGEYIIQEGEFGDNMYFIDTGQVEISIKKRDSKKKGLAASNVIVVATLNAGNYFGEFALVNDEPRTASVRCLEPTNTWALSKQLFIRELTIIGREDVLQGQLRDIADQRRLQNMKTLYPMRVAHLKTIPLFANWTPEKLTEMISKMTPYVTHANDVIVREDEPGKHLYFIARGTCEVYKRAMVVAPVGGSSGAGAAASGGGAGNEADSSLPDLVTARGLATARETITPATNNNATDVDPAKNPLSELGTLRATLHTGDMFGEIACLFVENRTASVRSTVNCDLWRLDKRVLMEFMLADVVLFIQAKTLTNQRRAQWIPKLPVKYLLQCPLLQKLFGDKLRKAAPHIIAAMTPKVIAQSDVLIESGNICKHLYFVQRGELDSGITVLGPGQSIGSELVQAHLPIAETFRARAVCELWLLSEAELQRLHERQLVLNQQAKRSAHGTHSAGPGHSSSTNTLGLQPSSSGIFEKGNTNGAATSRRQGSTSHTSSLLAVPGGGGAGPGALSSRSSRSARGTSASTNGGDPKSSRKSAR